MINEKDFDYLAGLKEIRNRSTRDVLNKIGGKITKDAEEIGEYACQNFAVVKEVLSEEQFKYLAGCIMVSMENPCAFAFMLETLDNAIIPLCQTYKTMLLTKGGAEA